MFVALMLSLAAAQSPSDVLARPVSIDVAGVSVDSALRVIAQAVRGGGVRLSWSTDLLPPSVRVTLQRNATTVGDALRETLRGTGLGFVRAGSNHLVILRAPIVRADIPAAPATTDRVAPNPAASVPRPLDRVIVMGTPAAGGAERDLSVAVTAIDAEILRTEPATDMANLVRSSVPGIVAWDLGASGPFPQLGSVRGSSSFSVNYLKTYLDGVELASPWMLFAIDPEALARLEVIRGPQGSAMYGSDAISGVAQLITRKGTLGSRTTFTVSSAAGAIESAYASSQLAQRHVAEISGGSRRASYELTGIQSQSGAFVSGGGSSSGALIAGGRAIAGAVLFEATARGTRVDFSIPVNPDLASALGPRAAPRFAIARPDQVVNARTAAITAQHSITAGWRQTLVVGRDQNTGALIPQRNPASVADVLLGASSEDAARSSVRYSTSLRHNRSTSVASTFTAGAEWSHLERERSGSSDVVLPAPSGPFVTRRVPLYVDTMENSGAFAEWKLAFGDALFLHGGLRGERNSAFGSDYGTAWSPGLGAAFVRDVADLTWKFRATYGKGIRPPPPSARRALAAREFRQMANATLAPESQEGVDAGLEIYSMQRFTFSATVFDQSAEGLIQHVRPDPRSAPRTIQQQNVGRITNRGVELFASGAVGFIEGEASLSTVTSRVAALSPSYTGDLRVGDVLPEVPEWSATAALRYRRRSFVASAGLSVLGEWTGYDWLRYYAADATGTTAPSLRDYSTRYEASVRPRVGVAYEGMGRWRLFARVENLTNAQHDSRDNLQITAGRTTWLGARFGVR